jgi:hypothetical protein
VNLVEIEAPNETIYAIRVSKVLWTDDQLRNHLVTDIGSADRSAQTDRKPFKSTKDLKLIQLLKGNLILFIYSIKFIIKINCIKLNIKGK